MFEFKKNVLLLRRWMLQNFVPEFFWPKQVELDGVAIQIRDTPYTFGTRWLIKKRLYEKEERELMVRILTPGMQVIEMGGSIGILTAVMANAVGTQGRVISVEASEKLTNYSKTWLEKLGNVSVVTGFGFPVWKAPAIQLRKFDERGGNLGGTLIFDIADSGKLVEADESLYDIQRLCMLYDFHPDVLAVDVEGTEIIIASQAANFPASISYVLIELHDGLYKNGKQDEISIHLALLNDGFDLRERMENVCLYMRKMSL